MTRTFFAVCTRGLEAVVADELLGLGAAEIALAAGGVRFAGPAELGWRACLWLRAAVRVQEELLADAPAGSPDALYDAVRHVPWERLIHPHQTLAVHALSAGRAAIGAPHYAALVVKDAVVDRLLARKGRRPSVDTKGPDVPLKLLLRGDRAHLYRDLAGDSLHKRGWRPVQVKSPLNEAIAAGLLLMTSWDRASCLVDPMCGSGTFLVEAAHLAGDRAPGLGRGFAFERWVDTDQDAWSCLRADAVARARAGRERVPRIRGADAHAGAIAIAKASLAAADVPPCVTVERCDVAELACDEAVGLVVANPPWGERLGDVATLGGTWHDLGGFLRRCAPADAWVLSGSAELTRHLGLRAAEKRPVRVGPIECRWLRYPIRA